MKPPRCALPGHLFRESAPCLSADRRVGLGAPGIAMANSATADIKRLLALAERMGLPASEAIHQVQELTPDGDAPDRPRPGPIDRRPAR